ncbi:hypothetical protein L1049_000118 [Liquidambar formosana]|uniref:tRNA pseudouridine synthase n=1 Tax=Liquidambar formosana TaxID=63359 RepID=A0AAP0NC67_LIQFO
MITSPRVQLASFRQQIRRSVMENQTPKKVYLHYNHTDPCKYPRWTARESYEFMYARPWQQVLDFYSNVVNGRLSLSGLFGGETSVVHNDAEILDASDDTKLVSGLNEDKTGRWARVTYKIVLSYHGGSFDGWQKQPGLNTVQGLVERSLGGFVDERKAQLLKDKRVPVEGCVTVAGRTDKGVTALQQVCSFYTWRKDVNVRDIEDAINSVAPGNIRVISVSEVSRVFHPNFSAKWRHYFYIFPFNDGEEAEQSSEIEVDVNIVGNGNHGEQRNKCLEHYGEENIDNIILEDKDELVSGIKPRRFSVSRVNQLLSQLEGKLLSYKMFARDTKASRNVGPPTECFIYHARATEARLPCYVEDDGEGKKVMCVELVANRFLRKMVRVLVATSIREAAAGAEDDALLKLMDATCRRATAPPGTC